MIPRIRELVQFYSLKFHLPVFVAYGGSDIMHWDKEEILLALPQKCSQLAHIGGIELPYDPDLGLTVSNDFIEREGISVARVGTNALLVLIGIETEAGLSFACELIDKQLPKIALAYRLQQKEQFLKQMKECAKERTEQLESKIRSSKYELESFSSQLTDTARDIALNQRLLKLFQQDEQTLRSHVLRRLAELRKLVPSQYYSLDLVGNKVIGKTHQIEIDHDFGHYELGSYRVLVNVLTGEVEIRGGRSVEGHIHPHIGEGGSVCWGNVGSLIPRMAAELDLAGVFTMTLQFLKSYNEGDAYEKLERWDPNWEEDEDAPYCSYCDEFGHNSEDCEYSYWCENCLRQTDHPTEDCPTIREEELTIEEEENAAIPAEAA